MSYMTDWALNQVVQYLKARKERDKRGNVIVYDDPVDIKCRFSLERKTVPDLMGNAVQSDFYIITDAYIEPQDRFIYRDTLYELLNYSEPPGIPGDYIGRMGYGVRVVA